MAGVKGRSGGPRPGSGRKPHSVEVYRKQMELTLLACVTEDAWTEVVTAALRQAQNGEAAARQWLSERVMGKVKDVVDHAHSGTVKQLVEVTYSRRAHTADPPGAPPEPGGDQA